MSVKADKLPRKQGELHLIFRLSTPVLRNLESGIIMTTSSQPWVLKVHCLRTLRRCTRKGGDGEIPH